MNIHPEIQLSDLGSKSSGLLFEWCFMPLLTVFQSYHGNSSHYSCLSCMSPVQGWGSEVSCPKAHHEKPQRIQCSWKPGPLDYGSNTLSLSHTGENPSKQSVIPYINSGRKKNLHVTTFFCKKIEKLLQISLFLCLSICFFTYLHIQFYL